MRLDREMLQDLSSSAEQRDDRFTGLMHSHSSSTNSQHSAVLASGTSASGAFLPMDLHLAQGYSFFASSAHNARLDRSPLCRSYFQYSSVHT